MKLTQFSQLQLGYTARGRLEPVEAGGARAIQLRDIAPEGGLAVRNIAQYRLCSVPKRYYADRGDILFRSRGDRSTATVLEDDFDGPAVAVMPLVIIRPQPDAARPAYLAWYINQPESQRYFDAWAQGTKLRMIPISCLADLEVPLPDLATQQAIAEINNLADREHVLSQRLAEKRRQLISLTLLNRARLVNSPQRLRGVRTATGQYMGE